MIETMQCPMSGLVAIGQGRVVQQPGGVAALITAAEQWRYSAQSIFELPRMAQGLRVVTVRLTVERGILGLGWLDAAGTAWIDRATAAFSAKARDVRLYVPAETQGGKLIFDNASEDGTATVALIEEISISEAEQTEEAQAWRLAESVLSSIGSKHIPNPNEILKLENVASRLSRDDFVSAAPPVPIIRNFASSVWEYAHGVARLTSYPWNISLPVADLCNARCAFCTSWLDGRKILDLDTLDVFEPVLSNALLIGLVGHGEPMAHPRFDELCDRLAKICDPISSVYTITNGFFLDKWRSQLERLNLHSYSISLNAATAETHDAVMGLGTGAFPRIVDSIARLTQMSERVDRIKPNVHITMVVTQQNLPEVPAFVELGNRLGVSEIWLRTLLPQPGLVPGLNYHELPPYLHPDFERLRRAAVAAIQASEVPVVADPGMWDQPLFSATLEDEIRRRPPARVSREAALRDRDLRSRNEFLYNQRPGIFRGRRLPDGSASTVKWADGRLHVITPAGSGAYAAAIPIGYPSDAAERLHLEIEAVCEGGTLGLGVLDEATHEWLDRALVESAGPVTATLEAAVTGQKIQLVVHNGGDGTPARGSIGAVRLKVDGIGQSLPVDFAGMIAHNAIDPLDDGSNPLGREPRFACKAVYYNLYINEFFYRVNPCCYLQQVPGFEEVRLDGDLTFMEAWNSPGMVELRRRLKEGPLFGACMRCPEKW